MNQAADRRSVREAEGAGSQLDAFRTALGFSLDPFQEVACRSLEGGRSVLVAAPTGAGKTVVAEFVIHLAVHRDNTKVFYTTPMKALSNQKFQEFIAVYGSDSVGLLTGDSSVNPAGQIVVMTTEVLRNMIYADSPLMRGLGYVVMDEVHYLADRFRGAVWEEVIIHLPASVRMVSLSATVSNAEEFGAWLDTVRDGTDVIVSEQRPVPLHQHMIVQGQLHDLFCHDDSEQKSRVNPELARQVQGLIGGGSGRNSSRWRRPHRGRGQHGFMQIKRSAITEMLAEQKLLPAIFFIFSRAGCDGAVQQLLWSGIRLTTVDERQEIRHIVETRIGTLPNDDLAVLGYWQWLDGLQRGIAAHHAGLLPAFKEIVEELFRRKLLKVVFATETLALGINMPARTVVLEKLEKFNGEMRVPVTPGEYTQFTGRAGRRGIDTEGHAVVVWRPEVQPSAVAALASRRSYPLNSSFEPTYNMAVNLIDQYGRRRTRELLEASFAQFQADRAVVDLAHKARKQEQALHGYQKAIDDRSLDREERARWQQRWHKLSKEHSTLLRHIERRTGAVAQVFDRVTEVLLETGHLLSHDTRAGEYLLSPAGRSLKRIYGSRDLLVAESLRRKLWTKLDAETLAAIVAALVYEPKREEPPWQQRLPGGRFRTALDATAALWAELNALEKRHGLDGTERLATGLCLPIYEWARGISLDRVLEEWELAAGDFVRWAKQVIDLLDQISMVADGLLARTARQALTAVRRGIVAYNSVEVTAEDAGNTPAGQILGGVIESSEADSNGKNIPEFEE